MACDILSICMSNLELNRSENKYYLDQCLQHPNDAIKLLGLNKMKEIYRESEDNLNDTSVQFDRNVTISVIKCLESKSTQVGASAMTILFDIFRTSNYLDDNSIRSNLQTALDHSDITRCRVYEVCARIAKLSTTWLATSEFILQPLIGDIDSTDILLQLNVLEVLANLSLANHGYVYLDNNGVFVKITNACQRLDENPLKNLLVPGYMNFFGTVSTEQPEKILCGFPQMINMLFDFFWNINDYAMLPAAFDNMGKIVWWINEICVHAEFNVRSIYV